MLRTQFGVKTLFRIYYLCRAHHFRNIWMFLFACSESLAFAYAGTIWCTLIDRLQNDPRCTLALSLLCTSCRLARSYECRDVEIFITKRCCTLLYFAFSHFMNEDTYQQRQKRHCRSEKHTDYHSGKCSISWSHQLESCNEIYHEEGPLSFI